MLDKGYELVGAEIEGTYYEFSYKDIAEHL